MKKMNFFRQLVASFALVFAISAGAQSSPTPAPTPVQAASTEAGVAEAAPSPAATVSVEPPSLIPPDAFPSLGAAALPAIPAGPDLQMLNALFKQSSLGKVADEYRLHLQMVGLETRIRNDQDLHALKASADKARTDLDRRHRLRVYYQNYYKKLLALASTPDLQGYIRAQQAAREVSLLQPRVRHETDAAEVAALARLSSGASASATTLRKPVQARANEALRDP